MDTPSGGESDAPHPRVSVVVPAFNEEDGIVDCVNQLTKSLSSAALSHEIIVVNDGSTDNTLLQARSLSSTIPSMQVIDLPRNLGKKVALKEGIRSARGELVAFFDADLQYRPDDLITMILMMEDGIDCVNGRRDYAMYGVSRTILSRFYNGIVRLLFQVSVADSNCGIKVLKRHAARAHRILDYGTPLLVPMLKLRGFRSKEFSVPLRARSKGQSKYFNDGQFLGGPRNIRNMTFHVLKLMSLIARTPLEIGRVSLSSELGNSSSAPGAGLGLIPRSSSYDQLGSGEQAFSVHRSALYVQDGFPQLD